NPGGMHPEPDGLLFKYFFWDAYYKGWLLPDAGRDARLAEMLAEAERREEKLGLAVAKKCGLLAEAQRELRTEMALDSALYFGDLWTTLALTRCHTLWTPLTRKAFTRPRKGFPDGDPGPAPPEYRYTQDQETRLAQLRGIIGDKCVRDAAGQWQENAVSA